MIESSTNLTFAPFNVGYPRLRDQAKEAEIDPNENKWELIFDFTPIKNDEDENAKNYQIMPPNDWKTEMIEIEGTHEDDGQPYGPAELVMGYPLRYGGTLSDTPPESSAEHNAFGITTGVTKA